ncbi:MAG: AAA family ATPase [Proteobacteria bacterium]|nr:AAA family ATPase [Pseudomonadota bacterium]
MSSPAELLTQGLNPPQAEAVQHTEGALLVLAGAGTGKTSVLTRRIAYLMLTQAAYPSEILAVTFTNKAAREMAERTEKLVGVSTSGMWLGTFHRLGVRLLRQHPERVGLRKDFVILDPDDQQRLIAQLLKDAGIDVQQFPPRQVAGLINRWKDNAWHPGEVPADELGTLGARAATLYAEYQSRLQALNATDFGDLLLLPLTLLTRHEDLARQYQSKFKYILVDEYQDTNTVQYLWLKALAKGHGNIAVVGDDDQSIYSWRGAQVANILRFEHDYPGAHVIRLEQNYRSTGHILAAANAVIANNRQRHGKNLWTDTGDGLPIEVHPMMDDREEARFVADAAWQHTRSGGRYEDLAVLVRTAAQTRSIEEALIRAGLPYVVVGGLRFYERKEIRDALAYLRLIANPNDDLAFQRIVNVPKRGVGEVTLASIESAARSLGSGQLEATASLISNGELTGRVAGALQSLLDKITGFKLLAQMETPDRLAERVLEDSGYLDMLRNDKEEDAKSRIDNLKELLRALQEYPDLSSFLEHVALVSDADVETGEAVKLMTIHAAKGLEFPTVFLPGFEEGLFPHQRAMNEEGQKGLEEERRLAYVALTRAKKRLVISFAHARRMWGQFLPGMPSRFLAEIPAEHVEARGATGFYPPESAGFLSGSVGGREAPYQSRVTSYGSRPQAGSRMDKRTSHSSSGYAKPAEPLVFHNKTPLASIANAAYAVGQKVHHAKFGPGQINAVEGSGENTQLTIAFKHAGTKKLLATLANLQTS